jgi:hypothetical protein
MCVIQWGGASAPRGEEIDMPNIRVLAGLLVLVAGPAAQAQDQTIQPSAADNAAAMGARRSALHPMPANTPAAAKLGKEALRAAGPTTTPFQNGRPRYIGDLSYQGGHFVDNVQSHAVYVLNKAVNCATPSCWGSPENFLRDLGASDFIHITDQYVGRHDDNRYNVGGHATVTFSSLPHELTDSNVLAVVHAVASQTHQTGYNHIYHVFLPPGTDECFDSTFTVCYSPDVPSTFYFCAYHSSVDFSDIGHVLYSVEPFENISGCNVAPGSPNGQLVDSTASVLSHELFESITDPDGDAWWNTASNDLFGDEIADECSFIIFLPGAVYFDPPAFNIGGKKYAVQSEYNNSSHACTTEP